MKYIDELQAQLAESEAGAAAMLLEVGSVRPGRCGNCPGHWQNHGPTCFVAKAIASNSGRKIIERLQAAEKCIDTLWRELGCTDVIGWVISDQSKAAINIYNSLK